jgi:hypothetical protein
VSGHRFTLILPGGRERFNSESVLGNAFRGTIDPASEQEIRRIVQESVPAAGLSLVELGFARPLGRLAPEVIVETAEPDVFVRQAEKNLWRIVAPLNRADPRPRVEGTYVLVRDPTRTWVAASGYSVRTSGGVLVVNDAFG